MRNSVDSLFYSSSPHILFLDMNSFFASVEQQEHASLRNVPVIVAPVLSDTTCAISASYEARCFGIKTGTLVSEAKALCPGLHIVEARPKLYVRYNHRIVELLHHFFVEIYELSIDEMACLLPPSKKTLADAVKLAEQIKAAIRFHIGETMECSIGIAPNIFLAKVASDFQKPNGLTCFTEDYTDKLFSLSLRDLPGIGTKNEQRLKSCGIYSVEHLWNASLSDLRKVWGGTIGERWHYMLRGNRQIDYGRRIDADKKSVSQSHVLPPQFRTSTGARDMLLKLAAKALKRLRSYEQAPRTVFCRVSFRHLHSWSKKAHWEMTQSITVRANDDLCWLPLIHKGTEKMRIDEQFRPVKVSVYFSDLRVMSRRQLSFLEDRSKFSLLFHAIDRLKDKGSEIHIAQIFHLSKQAPFRIAFGGAIKEKID